MSGVDVVLFLVLQLGAGY